MEPSTRWISHHALPISALLLMLALLVGDLIWRRAAAAAPTAIPRTGARGSIADIVIMLALLAVFGALAAGLRAQAGLVPFDLQLASGLQHALPLPVLRTIGWITYVGNPWWLSVASLAIAGWLASTRRWLSLALWSFTLAGMVLIDESLKACFRRERPLNGHGYLVVPGWSFPSGHACGAIVFYGLLAWLLLPAVPSAGKRRLLVAAAVAVVTLTGLSRVLLQAHYLSDVLAGYAIGAAWLMICVGIQRRLPWRGMSLP